MKNSEYYNISGIGRVLFEKSRRAKRICITVKPPGHVRVAFPAKATLRQAVEFANRNRDWILGHLAKLKTEEIRNLPLKNALREIDTVAAQNRLKDRLACLAGKHGFTFSRVTVRNQNTRWGSCSSKDNISLNIKLVLLPDELFDYVLLHELVHTRIRNHSREFWDELDKYTGSSRALAKRLKNFNLQVIQGTSG